MVVLVLRVIALPGQMPRNKFRFILTGTFRPDDGPDMTSSNF